MYPAHTVPTAHCSMSHICTTVCEKLNDDDDDDKIIASDMT